MARLPLQEGRTLLASHAGRHRREKPLRLGAGPGLRFEQAREKLIAAKTLLESEDVNMEQVTALQNEAESLKERAEAMKAVGAGLDEMKAPQMPAPLPT